MDMTTSADLRQVPPIVYRKLGRERAHGQALMPEYGFDYPKIEIDERLKGRALVETIIHEALHVARPHLSEKDVTEIARFQAMVLWSQVKSGACGL